MKFEKFPNCCGAQIITGLGSGDEVAYIGSYNTVNEIKQAIKDKIKDCMTWGEFPILVAITNNTQVNGERALEELGFSCSDDLYGNHETTMKLWWVNLKDEEGNWV